jgi:hypothetical protein
MSGNWDFGGQVATSDQFLKNSYLLFELAYCFRILFSLVSYTSNVSQKSFMTAKIILFAHSVASKKYTWKKSATN